MKLAQNWHRDSITSSPNGAICLSLKTKDHPLSHTTMCPHPRCGMIHEETEDFYALCDNNSDGYDSADESEGECADYDEPHGDLHWPLCICGECWDCWRWVEVEVVME